MTDTAFPVWLVGVSSKRCLDFPLETEVSHFIPNTVVKDKLTRAQVVANMSPDLMTHYITPRPKDPAACPNSPGSSRASLPQFETSRTI